MNKPISTFDKICTTATAHFALYGYDASSLNMIAEAVGIRKASLYSHFQSKNELFKTIFFDAYQQEQGFMQQCFTQTDLDSRLGETYCQALPQRFKHSPALVLFLKASFIAPDFLQQEIKIAYADYLSSIGQHFVAELKASTDDLTIQEIEMFQEAYLGIIDSLHIELIYSTLAAYEKKQNAMLEVLSIAIRASVNRKKPA